MAQCYAECGESSVVVAQVQPVSDVHVHVKNKGTCPIKVYFYRNNQGLLPRTVSPGHSRDIHRDKVTGVKIDCLGEKCDEAECGFEYEIDTSKAVRSPCGQAAVLISLNHLVTVTVKVKNKGHCPVRVQFLDEQPLGRTKVVDTMFVNPKAERSKTVEDVNTVGIRCRDEQTDDDRLDETAIRCLFTYEVSYK
jgi:hypothetical protein